MLNNSHIKRSQSVRYLGIILDEKLSWKNHINDLETKLIKVIKAFKILKNWLPLKEKRKVYFAYVHSKIKYGIQLYGTANKGLIHKIQVMQNRAIKTLFQLDYYTPTLHLLSSYDLLSVKDLYRSCVAQFVYKQRVGLLPPPFTTFYKSNATANERPTRQSKLLKIERVRTEQGKKMIRYSGAAIWNDMIRKTGTNMTELTPCLFKRFIKRQYQIMYR